MILQDADIAAFIEKFTTLNNVIIKERKATNFVHQERNRNNEKENGKNNIIKLK